MYSRMSKTNACVNISRNVRVMRTLLTSMDKRYYNKIKIMK